MSRGFVRKGVSGVKRSAIKLPRRQLFRLRGNSVEVAVGILAVAILESQADASPVSGDFDHLHTHSGQQNATTSKELHGALGHLADFQPDTLKTLSLDDLKALLTPEALKSLGLNADFAQEFDADAKHALKQLESAFRKKIGIASHHAAMASAADHQHDAADHVADGEHHHLSVGDALGDAVDFLGGVPFIIPLLGIAAAGGIVYAVAHDDKHTNHVPVANNDAVTTNENAAITFDPRSNDTDSDGDALTVTQVNGTNISATAPVTITSATGAAVGTVSLNTNGTLTFTPARNFFGTPSFTYTISDGNGGIATATVSLTVTHVNQAPVATVDSFTTNENSAIVINVLANDTDPDGDTLRVTQVNGTAISTTQSVAITGGSLLLNAAGNLVFTPTTNFSGTPTFTYTVSDGSLTATGTVNGTVVFVNQAPTEVLTSTRLSTSAGVAIAVPAITVGDVDSANLTTTVTAGHGAFTLGTVTGGAAVAGSGTGTLVLTGTQAQINATLAQLKFTGTTGFTGSDTLTVTTNDGALSTSVTIALTIGQVASGFVQDGYISGATVFFDANGNGVFDPGEATGVTDATGHYVITSAGALTGNLIAFGGTNIDTGLANQSVLMAPAGSSVINPLTTLVAQVLAANPTFSLLQASNAVSAALGLPAGTDYTHYDFLTATDTNALAVNKAAVQIVTFINSVVAAGGTSAAAINAIGTMTSHGGTVDFTSTTIVTNLLMTAGLSASAAATAATGVVSISQAIAAATSTAGVTQTVHDLNQTNVNLPPVVGADKATTTAGHAVTINVLANDKDPEGGSLIIKAINGIDVSAVGFAGAAVTGGVVAVNSDGTLTFTPNAGFTGSPTFSYTVADDHGNLTSGLVSVTVSADTANVAPVAANDTASTALHTPVTIDVLGNDTDANHDTLTVTQVNGTTIGSSAVAVTGGTVASDDHGHLVFTPGVATVGNSTFTYTADDGHGGTSTATVTVDTEPTSPIYSVAPGDLPAVVAHAADLGAHGVTTIDLSGTGVAAISDSDATALVAGGLHFAADDHVQINATPGHTHLSTTLKGLEALEVSAVGFAGGAVSSITIDAGTGDLGGLAHGGLPTFDPALHVTLDVAAGTLSTPASELHADASALYGAGIDSIGSATGSLTLNAAQAEAIADTGLTFDPNNNVTVTASAADLPLLADAHLAGLNIDTIDVSGAATITDAEAANLIQSGIHFAAGDHVTVDATAGHTHLSTTLKGLADLEVSAVAFAGAGAGVGISIDAGTGDLGGLAHSALPTFDPALHVTLDINPGTLDSALDLGAVATTFAHDGIDAIGVLGNGSLSLNATQAEGFATSGLVFDPAANITVTATAAELPLLADAHLAGLNIDTIDVSGAATITDAEAANLIQSGIHFAAGDHVTVDATAGHTHLSTTLKGLADLEVSAVAFAGAGAGVGISIDAGTGDLGGLAHSALPTFDPALHVTLDINPGTLDSALDLGAVATTFAHDGIDAIGVLGNGSLDINVAQAEGFATSGLVFDPAATVTVDATAANIGDLADHAASLAGLNIDQINVTGAASITDAEAAALVHAGLHFANGDTVSVVGAAGHTHLSTTLKGLQDLEVSAVAFTGAVSSISIDAGTGDLGSLAHGALPHFDSALHVTLDIDPSQLSSSLDLGSVGAAFHAAGIDSIGVAGGGNLALTVSQAESFSVSGLTFDPATNVTINASAAEATTLADNPFALHGLNVDAIHVTAPTAITDVEAVNLIEAGLHFATGDQVALNVGSAGTHLSTSLKGLHDLNVNSIAVATGVSHIELYAGDLHNLQATDIPSFVTAQTNAAVDVTLKVDISEASEVSRLAAALATAGVDHIQFNQPLSSLTTDQQAALNQSLTANHLTATFDGTFTGANAVAEVASGATLTAADTALAQSSIYRDLLTSFETSSDTHGHGGVLQLADGATASLAEAGMLRAYTAETLVVDGRTSGDHLLTTLKDIADIGVDSVKLAAQTSSAPVYIDLGVHAASDIQTLFQNLDLDGHATGTGSIFSGNQAVALVLDADAANALSHTDGALSHLASLGFTEVDVLAAPGTSGSVTTDPSGLQIKVISADDPLYHHLHPATGG